jgi:hypothetical protein
MTRPLTNRSRSSMKDRLVTWSIDFSNKIHACLCLCGVLYNAQKAGVIVSVSGGMGLSFGLAKDSPGFYS